MIQAHLAIKDAKKFKIFRSLSRGFARNSLTYSGVRLSGSEDVVNSQRAPVYRAPSQLLVGVGAAVLNEIDSTKPQWTQQSRSAEENLIISHQSAISRKLTSRK